MLTVLILLLSFVNFIILSGICIFYFKKNYIIMDIESYNILEEFVKEHSQEEQVQELPGGNGFFKEYVEEEEYDDE